MENRVSIQISAEAQTNIATAIATIEQNLPNLINLSNDERHGLSKMGDKSLSFVTKALEYSKQNPTVVPKFMDVNEFEIDLNAVTNLRKVLIPLHQLVEKLDDTAMLSGSEAFHAARIFYDAVTTAAKSNEPGMKTIYSDLKSRFPGRAKNSQDTTEVK